MGGYITISSVYEFLQAKGFNLSQIDFSVLRLLDEGLIESDKYSEVNSSGLGQMVRLTQRGSYHLSPLANFMEYIGAMAIDTPILDTNTRTELVSPRSMTDFLDQTKSFFGYLNEAWKKVNAVSPEYSWPVATKDVTRNINRLQKLADQMRVSKGEIRQ